MKRQIRGLSLTRPWPWAFVNGPRELQKRVENRSKKPPAALVGHYVALHAAQSWDEGDREFISRVMGLPVPPKAEHPHSGSSPSANSSGTSKRRRTRGSRSRSVNGSWGPTAGS